MSHDIQMEFMRNSAAASRRVGIWCEAMILPGIEDPQHCVDPRNLGQSEWNQQLGKIEYIFSLYEQMRLKWDDVYLLRGLQNIYSPLLCPPPLPMYIRTPTIAPWRCTWRPSSSILEMRLETGIEWTQRCTWRPGSSKFGDALGDQDRVNSEMHLYAVIERVWRCTWRPWSSQCGRVHGGGQSGGGSLEGRCDGSWDSIHWLTGNWGNVENRAQHGQPRGETGCEWETIDLGMMQYAVHEVHRVCSTQCMLYSVYTLDHGKVR